MGRNLVGDHTFTNILPVRQPEMLFWGDVTEHRRPIPTDHGRSDPTGDVVIARRDVGRQWPKRVTAPRGTTPVAFACSPRSCASERAQALAHYLNALVPSTFGQFTLGFQLAELRDVVGIRDRAGRKPSPMEKEMS